MHQNYTQFQMLLDMYIFYLQMQVYEIRFLISLQISWRLCLFKRCFKSNHARFLQQNTSTKGCPSYLDYFIDMSHIIESIFCRKVIFFFLQKHVFSTKNGLINKERQPLECIIRRNFVARNAFLNYVHNVVSFCE